MKKKVKKALAITGGILAAGIIAHQYSRRRRPVDPSWWETRTIDWPPPEDPRPPPRNLRQLARRIRMERNHDAAIAREGYSAEDMHLFFGEGGGDIIYN